MYCILFQFILFSLLLKGEDFNLTDFYQRTGVQFEDLVHFCEWRGEICNDSLWTMQLTHYGMCYTFNPSGSLKVQKTGFGEYLC